MVSHNKQIPITEESKPQCKISISGIIGELIGGFIGLYIIGNLLDWKIGFILPSWSSYIPIARTATIAIMVVRILAYMIPICRLQQGLRILAHLVSFYSLYYLVKISPFDFQTVSNIDLNIIVHFALVVAMIGIIIGTVADFIKLVNAK